jgi:hypothetical protein
MDHGPWFTGDAGRISSQFPPSYLPGESAEEEELEENLFKPNPPTLVEALHNLVTDASSLYFGSWTMDAAISSEKLETDFSGGPYKGLLYRVCGDDDEELTAVVTCADPNTLELRSHEHFEEIYLMISELHDVPEKFIRVDGAVVRIK